jgi:hypothetical protein
MEYKLEPSFILEKASMTTLSFLFFSLFQNQTLAFFPPIFIAPLMTIFGPKSTLGYHGLS